MNAVRKLFLFSLFAVLASSAFSQKTGSEADPYEDDPYWYKPGHAINPAAAASIQTLPGFTVDRVLTVPKELGSWTALCVDPQGRLIASAQHLPGLYRINITDTDHSDQRPKLEKLSGAAEQMGWSQGLLHAFGSLYVTVAESNLVKETGLYRITDTNGDDQYDKTELLFPLDGSGEHGPHNLVQSPAERGLYLICGNNTRIPDTDRPVLPVSTEGLDHILPPGFNSSRHSIAGFVLRFDKEGRNRQVFASGLRNSYDLAFNKHGDLFTFDSDMEWDLGTPWYRPTRICHIVSGAEFGWRENGANWPDHFEDSSGPVINIGPGSPTGMIFGYGSSFPEKYQNALFVCDWTFAAIHAVHLKPVGASYHAEFEEFVGGAGLPITDIALGKDGALYFIVGGRRLGSAIYRVKYNGTDESSPFLTTAALPKEHATRRELENYHEFPLRENLDNIWKHLGCDDRSVRFAARVALEKLPVDIWKNRVGEEADLDTRLTALLALARQSPPEELRNVVRALTGLSLLDVTPSQRLRILRICELVFARSDLPHDSLKQTLLPTLKRAFPDDDPIVNRELSRLLCYLGNHSVIPVLLTAMRQDVGAFTHYGLHNFSRNPKYGKAIRDILESAPLLDRMHYAKMLLWIKEGWTEKQRLEYFELIADAKSSSKGGYWYRKFWNQIREVALSQLDADLKNKAEQIVAVTQIQSEDFDLPTPIGPGQAWTLQSALRSFANQSKPISIEAGKRAYAAAACITCHRMGLEGSAIGPDLSALGQRFTPSDILEAIIDPNRAISDQYRMTVVTTILGESYSGQIVARDDKRLRLATNVLRPSQTISIATDTIASEQALPVSTMPDNLLDSLSEYELQNLLAYLVSNADPNHPIYRGD